MLGSRATHGESAASHRGWLAAGLATALGFLGTAHCAPNILLIIGDDMGVETLASYGLGENPPMTANLDDLAQDGVRFTNFWSQPVCSPTRATVVTGRYGFRTGVGRPVTNRGQLPEPPPIPDWALANTSPGMGGGGMGADGTPSGSVTAPFRPGRAKGAVYQGGVNVPFIVTGPGVQRGAVSDALVNSTDLFVTIMEMAGIDPSETIPADITHDSVSFLATLSDPTASTREWVYADEFFGGFAGVETADYAMRDERYKLLRFNGVEEFYDLQDDPYEHNNLLAGELSPEESTAYATLRAEVEKLRAGYPPNPRGADMSQGFRR